MGLLCTICGLSSPSVVRGYTCPFSFSQLLVHVTRSSDQEQTVGYQEREAKVPTQGSDVYLWCQSIRFQQLSSPATVTVFNEISGVEPTALFQEEEITVKKPQEDIKIMF